SLQRTQIQPPYFQAPHTAPLPPETYTYLIHALLSLQGSAYPLPAPTYPPLPNYNFPWPLDTVPQISSAPIAGPSSFYPTNPPILFPPHVVPPSPGASPTTPSTAQDPEEMEEATSVTEDKRRRNTAASARFRVKKKLKTLSLERTVGDLTGRADELEREANDLRRENAWLKEIVLLKGRNIAALNFGSQASAPDRRHDQDEKDNRTHAESESESTVNRGRKGKAKES
ncbi:hypothetical protein EV363DRAFT_1153378, partial [Boletus edulis]